MKLKFVFFVLFIIGRSYAISSTEVSKDLDSLMTKINKVTQDLNSKQQHVQSLNHIIEDSSVAINQSKELLSKLHEERELELDQLDGIMDILPQINQATLMAESNTRIATTKLYQQIRLLESSESNSILLSNSDLQKNRHKRYLIILLTSEANQYKSLQAKLEQLTKLNNKINAEVDRLDKELGITTRNQSVLKANQLAKLAEATKLKVQIDQEKSQLLNMKTEYASLNKLLRNLSLTEQQNQLKRSSIAKQVKIGPRDDTYEDNSPFLYRKLNRPIDGVVKLSFGEMHGGIPNNGILFKATNSNVYTISSGRVLYVGVLPGFGQMVVIDHGDNYVAIYGGVLPKVTKGQRVLVGQVIGNSGVLSNQPMGGVYFELRHFGRPVNPSKLS